MEASFVIGRVRGIPIGIHSSWLIVFGLLTYSLADWVFPSRFDGWSTTAYWVTGALASLLLFGSVIAHEMGHAVAAQRRGVGVKSITLFIFGGVATLEHESEDAGDEFVIAIAGPAVSLLIAIVSGILGVALIELSEQVGGLLAYLATSNLYLVLFNLIPAFPLDGGRVFRAFLWHRSGSLAQATRTSANVGMVFGYLFMVAGIFLVFQSTFSGVWLIAIGWFLRSAAEQSTDQVALEQSFAGIRVAALMDRGPATVAPHVSIADLVNHYIMAKNVHGLPVCQDGELVGIITLTDVKDTPGDEWARLTVRDKMTPVDKLVTVTPETELIAALRQMAQLDIHQVPVQEDGKLVGLLNRSDLLHFIQLRQSLPNASPLPADLRRSRPIPVQR